MLKRISAVIIGVVFFFSGLLKMMDPLGSGLIVEEYLKFFHLGFLRPASVVIAEALSLVEAVTGVALITGMWMHITCFVTLGLLAFFTLTTVLLNIYNPPMDCGCFGEAIHLTHLQSLVKNLVMLALWAVAFIPMNHQSPGKGRYAAFLIATASVVAFLIFFTTNPPAMDFTPFKPGTELMGADDGYSEDSPILSFSDRSGEYADSLALEGRVMVFSVFDPESLDAEDKNEMIEESGFCREAGIMPLTISAGETPGLPDAFFADRRTLMTLNRSNGGATLICDGQIVAKWKPSDFPDREELVRMASANPTETMISEITPKRLVLQIYLLLVFMVMLLLKLPDAGGRDN